MTGKLLFAFCLVVVSAMAAAAQARTITDLDLEQYKEKRIAAERDLRENYAKMGFSSPEERERRLAQDAKDLEELSSRLRNERLARESYDAQRAYAESLDSSDQPAVQTYSADGVYYSSPGYYRYRRQRTGTQQQGYYAAGQFWPTGPRTRPQPLYAAPKPTRSPAPRPRH